MMVAVVVVFVAEGSIHLGPKRTWTRSIFAKGFPRFRSRSLTHTCIAKPVEIALNRHDVCESGKRIREDICGCAVLRHKKSRGLLTKRESQEIQMLREKGIMHIASYHKPNLMDSTRWRCMHCVPNPMQLFRYNFIFI